MKTNAKERAKTLSHADYGIHGDTIRDLIADVDDAAVLLDEVQRRGEAWPGKLQEYGYVFEHIPTADPDVKAAHPFELLAFWLYTDLARLSTSAADFLKEPDA